MKTRMPGKLAHTLAILLTLLMTLTLLLSVVSWQGVRLMTDEALHRSVSGNEAVTAAQMEQITAVVNDVAAQQFFAPETVMTLITEDSVRDYSLQCTAWWMGLLQSDPVIDAPAWDTQAIEDAVREDELFRENVRSTLRRSVARDDVAYPIALAVQEAVLPIRTQLISFVMPEVLSRVDVPSLLSLAFNVPLMMLAVSAVLALLILLVMFRSPCKGGMYIGSGLAAGALLTMLLMLGVLLLNPASVVAQANALLALQLNLLLEQLALPLLAVCAAGLVGGYVLIALHQRRMRRMITGSIPA